jgi:uncharacterized membrane protein YdcZ (DUF606 family)
MPWNLLILPLLGGFLFLRLCYYFNIRLQRYENYRLVFEAAAWGVGMAVLGRLSAYALHWSGIAPWLQRFCRDLAPWDYFGTSLMAFFWGPCVAWLINWRVEEVGAKDLAVEQAGDNLLALTIDAMDKGEAIMLTLDNRKVYVGYVWESPNLRLGMNHVLLLPAISGYRDRKTLEVEFTTNYIRLWAPESEQSKPAVPASEFVAVIPVNTIKSASVFDMTIYDAHFRERQIATA